MIQREIMRNNSGERTRLACWFSRLAKTDFQNIVVLLHTRRDIPNRSHKSVAGLFPMKDLAGIKRHRQIEIWCGNFNELHRWIALSSTRCQSGAEGATILASASGEADPPCAFQ